MSDGTGPAQKFFQRYRQKRPIVLQLGPLGVVLDRLGELALVTGESRVGQTKTLFYNTLFDENATCHIAFGAGLEYAFDGEPDEGMNVSNIHVDFMVGGPELEVDALLADGTVVPLIRDEVWQLS